MTPDRCPTDLIAKDRRNELSPLERRVLERHLATCQSCRGWQRLGHDFDSDAGPSVDDAAVVQRIADAVRLNSIGPTSSGVLSAKRSRSRPLRWALLAAFATSAAAAAAVTGWTIARDIPPPEVDASATRGIAILEPPPPNIAITQAAQAADEATGPSQHEQSAVVPKPAAHSSAVANEAESALTLYRAANQARRSGDVGKAVALFRRLQQAFPRSPEARLSNVALGGALLESGAAHDALLQFDRYLAAGDKSLAAEALYGRARALGALGSRTAERAAWQRLESEFPRSPYSATAARRLKSPE